MKKVERQSSITRLRPLASLGSPWNYELRTTLINHLVTLASDFRHRFLDSCAEGLVRRTRVYGHRVPSPAQASIGTPPAQCGAHRSNSYF